MQVFILVTLAGQHEIPFAQPLLPWLKSALPQLNILDIDGFSDSILVDGACRLVQEAEKCVVYFKITQENEPLGASLKLLENLMQPAKSILIALEGQHRQLEAICSVRPHLQLIISEAEESLKWKVVTFFQPEIN